MTGTRKKTYAVVLAVGLGGLAVDRLFLQEPQSADASVAAPSPDSKKSAEAAAARTLEVLTAAPFPRNLPEPVLPLPRDGFSLTASITDEMQQTASQAAGPEAAQDAPGTSAAQFQQRHQLVAAISGESVGMAIVDDEWIRIGQFVDECRLTEITGRSALFECRDGLAEITVGTPPTTADR